MFGATTSLCSICIQYIRTARGAKFEFLKLLYVDDGAFLGSKVTHNLDNRVDIEARKKQATKALGAMMKYLF